MIKRNSTTFAGLPAALVREMLEKTGGIAEDIYKPYHEITNARDRLRERLSGEGIVRRMSGDEGGNIPSSCGIDGYAHMDRILSSDVFCSAAFGVEGLVPPSGEKHWDSPTYTAFIQTERCGPAAGDVINGVKAQMEAELAAQAPHDIVFLNGTYTGLLAMFLENLFPALGVKDTKVGREFLARVKPSLIAFKTIFDNSVPNKLWAAFSENSTSQESISRLNLGEQYAEPLFFTIVLEPGEYTVPVPADDANVVRLGKIPIKDEKFSEVRDNLVAAASRRSVLYFRPHAWTPAFRLESSAAALENPALLGKLLACIRYQSGTPGLSTPYPVYSAVKMAAGMKQAIPALRKSAASHLTNMHTDDLGDIFPLVMFRTNNETGEY